MKKEANPGDDKILAAIKAKGFGDFKSFLEAHTIKPGGSTWELVEMADELGVGRSAFIGFHTRWVEREHGSVMP